MQTLTFLLILGAVASAMAALSLDVNMVQRVNQPCPTLLMPWKTCPIDVTMLTLTFTPGDIGDKPHVHSGPTIGYVLEGELLFQVKGKPHRIVPAGSTFYEDFGDVHTWGANGSNSTVCKVLATVYGQPGKDLVKYVQDTRTEKWDQAVAMARAQKP